MEIALNIVSIGFITVGLLFFLGATVGLYRFPDFYTRMHAAGKGDTLSSILILMGFAVYKVGIAMNGTGHVDWAVILVALKILSISLFIMLTSPTSTHALMEAGYDDNIKPWKRKKKLEKGKLEEE